MKLPRVSGKRTVEALLPAGFITHRVSGSRCILKHPKDNRRVTIPFHRKDLALETLHYILKQAALTPEEFSKLL